MCKLFATAEMRKKANECFCEDARCLNFGNSKMCSIDFQVKTLENFSCISYEKFKAIFVLLLELLTNICTSREKPTTYVS